MADFLDWLFALRREDVLWLMAATGLIAEGWSIGVLHGRLDKMRAELKQRGVL